MMRKLIPAANPDAYVAGLSGWQRAIVDKLRKAVRGAGSLEELVKWGHLVYMSNGPALLIRAEEQRVLFGFWRGERLRSIERRLKPGGKYEMATLELREGTARRNDRERRDCAPAHEGSDATQQVARRSERCGETLMARIAILGRLLLRFLFLRQATGHLADRCWSTSAALL